MIPRSGPFRLPSAHTRSELGGRNGYRQRDPVPSPSIVTGPRNRCGGLLGPPPATDRSSKIGEAPAAAEEVIIAYRSPWQNPFVERLIGSIRRECLDHVIVFNEAHLIRILIAYFEYYHESRTHLSLARNAPKPRQVEPPELGKVVAIQQVGGLHHRYTRVV